MYSKDPLLSRLASVFKTREDALLSRLGLRLANKLQPAAAKYAVSTCFFSLHSHQLLSYLLERRYLLLLVVATFSNCSHIQISMLFQPSSFLGSIEADWKQFWWSIPKFMHGSAACYWVTRLSCFPVDAGFIDYYYASSDICEWEPVCCLIAAEGGAYLPACLTCAALCMHLAVVHLAVVHLAHLCTVHLVDLCSTVHCAPGCSTPVYCAPGCGTPGSPVQHCVHCAPASPVQHCTPGAPVQVFSLPSFLPASVPLSLQLCQDPLSCIISLLFDLSLHCSPLKLTKL